MKYLILILSLILSLACLSARIFADEPQKSPSQLKLRAQNMILEGEGQRNISTFDEQSSTLKISCISCGNNFMAVNTDLHAADRGMDRDFCCHSNNKSSYDFNVWTCSKCGYSNHKSFFSFGPTTAFTDAEKEAIKAQWVTVFLETLGVNLIQYAAPISQEDIPSFLKYQMMLSILPKLNLPWKVKADFYLNYAWIERLRFCASISSPTLSTTISSINESLKDYEKGKNLDHLVSNPKDLLVFLETLDVKSRSDLGYKFLLKLYQAAQMDRLGFNGRANEIVKEAILLDVHPSWRNIANFKSKLLLNEIFLLKEAIISIKEAIRNNEYQGEECSSVIYLLGELQRRIGVFPEADAWLKAAQENCPAPLKDWALEQRDSMPKSAINPISDGENILIHKALNMAIEAKEPPKFDPRSVSSEKAKKWLESLDLAAASYHQRYKIDPESLEELFDLDLLKKQPDLLREALSFFSFSIDKSSNNSAQRYSFDCLLPFSDDIHGFYMLSSIKGVITKKST